MQSWIFLEKCTPTIAYRLHPDSRESKFQNNLTISATIFEKSSEVEDSALVLNANQNNNRLFNGFPFSQR